jgi:hypothetical protein
LKFSIDIKNYTECHDLLLKLNNLVSNENEPLFKHTTNQNSEILVIKELNESFCVQRERLWHELDQEWDNKYIQITAHNESYILIKISNKLDQELFDKVTRFSDSKKSSKLMHTQLSFVFSHKLEILSAKFIQLCEEYLIKSNSDLDFLSEQDFNILKLTKNESLESVDLLANLDLKLNKLNELFQFLNQKMFNLSAWTFNNDALKSEKKLLMFLFSKCCLKNFLKLVYERLITHIIPVNQLDFELESKINNRISQFEKELKLIRFYEELDDGQSVETIKENLEELFMRKKCKYLIDTARSKMKSNDLLFDLVEIHLDNFSKNASSDSNNNNKLKNELLSLNQGKVSSELNLVFNSSGKKFSISRLAYEINELIYQTLNDAYKIILSNSKSHKNALLLSLIARNLFDLYTGIVPNFHENKMKTLPALPMILFNDFSFLAINCLTLTHQYKPMLKSLNSSHLENNINFMFDFDEVVNSFSFLDLSIKLQSSGYSILIKELEKQELNLIELLNEDSSSLKDLSEADNFDLFKRSLQKCTHQLKSLSSLWSKILSENFYYKIFGQLLDLLCQNLIKSCLKLEDISSDDASYLHTGFTILKQFVHELFSSYQPDLEGSMHDLNAMKYINSWQKFKYLLVILKANLQDIVDLWSDGKGPLSLCYDSEEVRHLIRALFMITERRSAALARIK